jgi:hypothetical protein
MVGDTRKIQQVFYTTLIQEVKWYCRFWHRTPSSGRHQHSAILNNWKNICNFKTGHARQETHTEYHSVEDDLVFLGEHVIFWKSPNKNFLTDRREIFSQLITSARPLNLPKW